LNKEKLEEFNLARFTWKQVVCSYPDRRTAVLATQPEEKNTHPVMGDTAVREYQWGAQNDEED
jgi:hypothetical protein